MPVTIHDTSAEEAALAAGAPPSAPLSDELKDGAAPAPSPTPTAASADVVNGDGTVTVVDAKGRRLTVKKLKALDRLRALQAVGAENSNNLPLMSMIATACAVSKINEDVQFPPLSMNELTGRISILDDEGLAAAEAAYVRHFVTPRLSEEEERAALKF